MIDLQAIFGDCPAAALAAPADNDVAVGVLPHVKSEAALLAPFLDWVQRPDGHGRMGWEAPDLPDWWRWWARCDFDDLPEVPEDFALAELPDPAVQDCAYGPRGGKADALGLEQHRAVQGHLRGMGGV